MAEIKLTDSFTAEVESFRASAAELTTVNTYAVSSGNLALPTVDAYQERLYRIWQIMVKFGVLVKKDAADMDALAARLKAADATGS